ncbi:MAG: hypothetical protein AAFN77_21275 [Planctomycetota bacterium]
MKFYPVALLTIASVFSIMLPTQSSQAFQAKQSLTMIEEAIQASLQRLEKDFAETMRVSKLITKTGITGHNLITVETATPEGWTFHASVSDNGEWIKLIFPCIYTKDMTDEQLLRLLKDNCKLRHARFEEYFGMIHLVIPLENRSHTADELVDGLGLLYNEAKRTQTSWNLNPKPVAKKGAVRVAQVPKRAPKGNRPVLKVSPKTPQFSGADLKAKFEEIIGQNKLVDGFLTYRDQSRSGEIEFFSDGDTIWHAALKGEEPVRLSGEYRFENDRIKIQASKAQLLTLDLISVSDEKLVFQNERMLLSVDVSDWTTSGDGTGRR